MQAIKITMKFILKLPVNGALREDRNHFIIINILLLLTQKTNWQGPRKNNNQK